MTIESILGKKGDNEWEKTKINRLGKAEPLQYRHLAKWVRKTKNLLLENKKSELVLRNENFAGDNI